VLAAFELDLPPQIDVLRGSGSVLVGPGSSRAMAFILWLLAVVFVIGGIVSLLRGAVLYGLVLIVVGLLVGPGGVSVFA
jgi:hypothetical protein